MSEPSSPSDLSRVLTVERMQKGSYDLGHASGDAVYLLTEHVRRQTVHDRDEQDPGHFNEHYTVDFGHIPHASNLYWHVRARSVDTFGHKSEWTSWTNPINPATDPDLIISAPNYVALSFDRAHHDKAVAYRAIVEWAEVDYYAPDGDHEPDMHHYIVQLATSDGDNLDLEVQPGATTIFANEVHSPTPAVPFFTMIGNEIVEVTARDATYDPGEGNLHQYTVVRGQRGTVDAYHPEGSKFYSFPFLHKTASAKQDDDRNNYDRIVFPRAIKWHHYKARVRAVDRYNRRSDWTSWTADGTPLDQTAPHKPTSVLIDVDNHKVVTTWDIPVDPLDPDTDTNGAIPGSDVDFFQVQLSTQANFNTLLRNDRSVKAMSKAWRLKKPGNGTYYVRVRSVDSSGNKSGWVSTSGAQNGVPTPVAPTMTFDVNEDTRKIRALVLLDPGVTGVDDDVDGYEFELQPAEFKRIDEDSLTLSETGLDVTNSSSIPSTPFTATIQREKVRVTAVGGSTWTITRGYGGTTATTHRRRAKVQYFRAATKKRRIRTGEESEVDDPVLAIFNGIQKGLWYRARVRAQDTKGRYSNWSLWSG